MSIVPIGPRVLLIPKEPEEVTKSGIYIPDSAREKKKEGTVEGVGENEDGKTLPLKKGDHVLYGGYSSDKVEIDGQEYVFVEFKDILAKID